MLDRYVTRSQGESEYVGMEIGKTLQRGSIVCLDGCLGAGKTCITRGIAHVLGVEETITSPTYTIINEYSGIYPFYHIDVYRLGGCSDFEEIGGNDILFCGGICVVEWSYKINLLIPENALHVDITINEDYSRTIDIRS
ncbi:MAG: tRNA (adenosine(37)-N6)-threonylcarbamoyltransferase complex ATPase subunit type 1 TsaE [Termitinemataceae bacterium]|nr:MAG: tRNA (adenosine(37)-N6)-threonylcarbamoyltransferase complex ATPase subunit type 1 TsaE [Termitinemataceae bacterium]